MQPAFVWTPTNNEWNEQNPIWSSVSRPSTTRSLISRDLTICHVKFTQSTALEQKGFDQFDRCRPHSVTFGYYQFM